jgi:hypothetical protein
MKMALSLVRGVGNQHPGQDSILSI